MQTSAETSSDEQVEDALLQQENLFEEWPLLDVLEIGISTISKSPGIVDDMCKFQQLRL